MMFFGSRDEAVGIRKTRCDRFFPQQRDFSFGRKQYRQERQIVGHSDDIRPISPSRSSPDNQIKLRPQCLAKLSLFHVHIGDRTKSHSPIFFRFSLWRLPDQSPINDTDLPFSITSSLRYPMEFKNEAPHPACRQAGVGGKPNCP